MNPGLKLYVWDGVLTDWTSGIAFALATSAEEAIKLLIKNGLPKEHVDGVMIDGVQPIVHCGRAAYHVYGGG